MSDQHESDPEHAITAPEPENLRTLIDNVPFGAGLFTMDGRLLAHNPEFARIYGMDEPPPPEALPEGFDPSTIGIWQLVDLGLFDHLFDDPRQMFTEVFQSLERGEDHFRLIEIRRRLIEIHDKPIGNGLFISTQSDVTDRVLAERQVEHMAWHDPLTGLPNRAAFTRELDRVIAEAGAKGNAFAIVSVDLDRFKEVNDVFGHSMGDALLKEVALRFEKIAGDCFVSRLGGDEFVFLCANHCQPEAIGELAEKLIAEVSGETEINGNRLLIKLSAGIAIHPDNGKTAEELLNAADAALYRAKEDGRATYRFFEPDMDQRIHNRRRLAQDLRLALSRGELSLHYQPQATVDGEVTGFEALLRWQHPAHGFIPPQKFIPIAEENGLIADIGAWVLRTACSEAAKWEEAYTVSVNLSPLQFRHDDLPNLVHQTLFDTGLTPARLELEITESVLVHDFPRALSLLRRIKALGVHVAMDDFGTGYSSLSYLQAFPFDKLKIDRSFIGKLESDKHAREIVRAVLGLGRGLNLPIVAEGVETAEQLQFLKTERCFGIQGYLLGRPQAQADMDVILGGSNVVLPKPVKKKLG